MSLSLQHFSAWHPKPDPVSYRGPASANHRRKSKTCEITEACRARSRLTSSICPWPVEIQSSGHNSPAVDVNGHDNQNKALSKMRASTANITL